MSSRYGTLDVNVSNSKLQRNRLNRTLQVSTEKDEEESSLPDNNDQRVNKFKELYFKNQKLRKELKLLNQKLNDKLDKLKLPAVKHKAMSVDLSQSPPNPPSKALVRQLQNGYKQIAMYRKQVQALKGKQDTSQNYDKLRNAENMITYMDNEINQVQEQLKSIKNVKKLQERVMQEDFDNAEQRQKMTDYQREIKAFKEKLKEIEKKKRKRQEEFKKQQAYLVALEQKIRKFKAEQLELDKPSLEKPKDANEEEFRQLKESLRIEKFNYDEAIKKTETARIQVKNMRQHRHLTDEKIAEKEVLYKQLLIQVETFTRLLKDLQLKKYELTGVRDHDPQRPLQSTNKFLKLEEIEDEGQLKQQGHELSKSEPVLRATQTQKAETSKGEREWTGKTRKVSMGYSTPTDIMFQQSGIILGMKVYFDENRYISGLGLILLVNQVRTESKIYGNASSSQQKWEVQPGDYISKITGSFTQQGYLASIGVSTWTAQGSNFGSQQKDGFQFNLEYGQFFSGIFGGFRRLGQDVRITEVGFWISKQ